ncbi:hypothetical protein ACIQCG_00915 [Streptomyces noursei]|uniref:hypothetical protein n=1 Tax=Streptomyces noursei TaxID=1971 RepID=UPI0037FB22FC
MSKLSPSVLPLIPSAFATGDRVSYWRCTFERLPSGTWACVTCGPAPIPFTDADIRDRFVNPPLLDALDGIPLIAPANVPADAPLPGRPVPDGENPWESGRPYLLCSTGNDVPTMLAAVQGSEPGPWGIAQAALTTPGNLCRGDVFEASMTETGTVFLRMTGGAVTLAYIPAEEPTTEESNALAEYNAMAALLDVL